jgi:hypothetical protein
MSKIIRRTVLGVVSAGVCSLCGAAGQPVGTIHCIRCERST